jgi:DNA-binding MarR family transcriptional regulator
VTELLDRDDSTAILAVDALAPELLEATRAIWRVTRRATRRQTVDPLLPPADVEVLVAVVDTPGMRVADTARSLGLASNTVSTIVTRLARDGLLARAPDRSDGRAITLRPTARGRARVTRRRRESDDLALAALTRLTQDDRDNLSRAVEPLRRLAEMLQALSEETVS